jgi:hypothetical protein
MGQIDRWALTGISLQRVRRALQVDVYRLSLCMGVGVWRVEQLEAQERTTRESAERYLSAVVAAWRTKPQMTAEEIQAMNKRRDAERERDRQRQHERYQRKHQERDQEQEHREHWSRFLAAFKAGAVAAFIEHCTEPADQVQPDSVGEELAALYERLAREHRARANVAELVRELERRGLMMRAGSVEVLVQVRDRPARGRRPGPTRMGTALRPSYEVWCQLSAFGRRLVQALDAAPGAV